MSGFLKIMGFLGVLIATVFIAAGRWDLPFVWACVCIYAVFIVLVLIRIDPDLLKERMHPGPGGKDRKMRALLFPMILGQWILVGLDAGRFHWSDTVPVALQVAALILFAAGMALSFWAMSENRFFSSVVRIQRERGHHVITTGPYRFVRHPGYLAAIVSWLCGSLALGSWWAMVPAAVGVGLVFRRLLIEDRFLHAELEGYPDYARHVPYQLLPGVW
jgi:protein-S-isoprenylcysteine O-methyltransferase Ste14